MTLATIVAGALALPAAPEAGPPTFAKDFYVGSQSALAINQGGYEVDNGVCCSLEHSSQCKLQFINMGSDVREQGTKNRTRSDSVQGAIVNWWGDVKKEMAIVPGSAANSTHKWACAAYCPLDGEFFPSLQIGSSDKGPGKPKDKGSKSITQPKSIGGATKTCEEWSWKETLLYVIPMQETEFYVDMSSDPPSPFYSHSVIEPFGNPLGVENASYIGYKAMDVSDSFDIDPDSIAQCPMSDQCQQNNELRKLNLMKHAQVTLLGESLRHVAERKVAAMSPAMLTELTPVKKDPPPEPNVTFASDYTSGEEAIMMIAQGGTTGKNGDPCCNAESPSPQCQVQLQHLKGTRYHDVTNQRTRFDDVVAAQTVVDDFNVYKSMLINITDGKETCQEYCPIDKQDKLEPFDPFDPFDAVTDVGPTTFEGKDVEHYSWKDVILKVITMQTTDFYADIKDPTKAKPVFMTSALTPFGQQPPIGRQNNSWTNFTMGTPSKDKFDIQGVDTCPRSSQCGDSKKQAHRLALRQHHTFANYHKA